MPAPARAMFPDQARSQYIADDQAPFPFHCCIPDIRRGAYISTYKIAGHLFVAIEGGIISEVDFMDHRLRTLAEKKVCHGLVLLADRILHRNPVALLGVLAGTCGLVGRRGPGLHGHIGKPAPDGCFCQRHIPRSHRSAKLFPAGLVMPESASRKDCSTKNQYDGFEPKK